MTTIATDGRIMAADGRACRGDTLVADKVRKIDRLSDGSLLGVSGRASTQSQMAAWLNGKGKFPAEAGDWSALHVRPDGIRLYSSDGGEAFVVVDAPAAIGSGSDFALGAMMARMGPLDAVRLAAKRDLFTGGALIEERLDD